MVEKEREVKNHHPRDLGDYSSPVQNPSSVLWEGG